MLQGGSFIRVIGDPVLHQPGILFPQECTERDLVELHRQIAIAKKRLIQTGGGGIAANQCAEIEKPYQLTIVGVFYEEEAHLSGVRQRYPAVNFPQAMIMVNPKVLHVSPATQTFYHGCLSVPCSNRCEIRSPSEMTVSYLDPLSGMKEVTVTLHDKAAVALWHELNHILEGKTYFDTALASLSPEQRTRFEQLVAAELARRTGEAAQPKLARESFYFTIAFDSENKPQLREDELQKALSQMTDETLNGLATRCEWLKNPRRVEGRPDAFFSAFSPPPTNGNWPASRL